MALAIIDDLGAIIIIALFYTNDLSMASLGVAAVAIAVLAVLNLCGVRRTGVLYSGWRVLWTAVLKSGFTQPGGVIVGFFIPFEREAWAFSSEATGACVTPVGGVSDFAAVCILLMLAFHCQVSRWMA